MPLSAIWRSLNPVSLYNNSFTSITVKEKYVKTVSSLNRAPMLASPSVSERRKPNNLVTRISAISFWGSLRGPGLQLTFTGL